MSVSGKVHRRHRRDKGFEKSHHVFGEPAEGIWSAGGEEAGLGDTVVVHEPVCNVGDTRCYTVDDFNRTVAPPTMSDGDWVLAGGPTWYQGEDGVNESGDIGWTYAASGISKEVESSIGTYHDNGSPCPGLSYYFQGWWEKESWAQFTVPAHPANMAGMTIRMHLTFQTSFAGPVSRAAGARVVVSSVAPTGLRQGTIVGSLPGVTYPTGTAATATIFIPGSQVPTAGSTMYVGIQANWENTKTAACGGFRLPIMTGVGNSGTADVAFDDANFARWQVYSGSEQDMGDILTDDENGGSAWDGGNDWDLVGGNATWSMDGQRLIVSSTGNGYRSWVLYGDGDTTNPPLPNAGGRWSPTFVFELSDLGSLVNAGDRYVEFIDAYATERNVVRVYFGDTAHAMGLEVNGVFEAVTLTADALWCVKWDTRNGDEIRAWLWERASGRPIEPTIRTSLGEAGDDPSDTFTMTIWIGNNTGTQTLYMNEWCAALPGGPCEWVKEFIGVGDGSTVQAYLPQHYVDGSVQMWIQGSYVDVEEEDAASGLVGWGGPAVEPAAVRAWYMVADDEQARENDLDVADDNDDVES